jgi:hypothetical protein
MRSFVPGAAAGAVVSVAAKAKEFRDRRQQTADREPQPADRGPGVP